MRYQRIVVFGGTGFVGRAIVTRLAKAGARVTVVARHPYRNNGIRVLPKVRLVSADVRDPTAPAQMLAGQDAAINLIGVLNSPPKPMRDLHAHWPARLASLAEQAGVSRLLHVSALGADPAGPSRYLRTKGQGEKAIRESQVPWTVLKPSVIFGPGDGLFSLFATMLKISPGFMPVIRPRVRMSPVYVWDVADAVIRSLDSLEMVGETLSLCGPEEFTMRELVAYTAQTSGYKRVLVNMPDFMARIQARFMSLLPGSPFTLDNFRSLLVDSVCEESGLARLGIEPTPVGAVVPAYLGALRAQFTLDNYRKGHSGPA